MDQRRRSNRFSNNNNNNNNNNSTSLGQGRSQDFTLGGTEAERRRRESRCAKGAERGGDCKGGVPLPNRLEGLGNVVSSPSGVRG